MRRFTSSWLGTLSKLGYRPVRKRRMVQMSRRPTIESLEQRLVFSTTNPTVNSPGNCTDDCQCECANATTTSDGSALTSISVAGVTLSYNSGTQISPVVDFNYTPSATVNQYVAFENPDPLNLQGYLGFTDAYYAGAGTTDVAYTFSFQTDASSLPPGRYYFMANVVTYDIDDDDPHFPHHERVYRDIVNNRTSAFGAGWQVASNDRLVTQTIVEDTYFGENFSGVSLITGDNHVVWFKEDLSQPDPTNKTVYTREDNNVYFGVETNPYSFAELVHNKNTDEYTLTDPDRAQQIFDIDGKLLSRLDRLGNVIESYTYVGDLLESITDIQGNVKWFDYDGGYLESITDFYGTTGAQTTYFSFDARHLTQIAEPDPDGAGPLGSPITKYEYNGDGLLESIVDPRGLVTTVAYDNTSHVSSITERCGGTIDITSIPSQRVLDISSTGYDKNHLATMVPTSAETDDEILDIEHRVEYQAGHDVYITRNSSSQITSKTDALGNTTLYTYSDVEPGKNQAGRGLLATVTQTDPDGDGPLGDLVTEYSYDDYGRVTYITYPDSTYEQITYDPYGFGQIIEYSDRMQDITSYVVNSTTGNVESMTQVIDGDDDLVTEYTYTDGLGVTPIKGLIETITDPNDNETLYTYYANGLVATITYANGTADAVTEEYEYDDRDRLEFFHDGRGKITQYVYDNLDRLSQRIDPDPDGAGTEYDSPVWKYRYDASGNQTHVIDPNGNDTEYVYDERGRLAETVQHKGLALTPVAMWKLDETAGEIAKDSAGNGHTAVVNGTSDWATGQDGNAFQFDGNTKLEAPSLMGESDDVTIAAWANLTTTGNLGAEIVSLGDHFALRLDSGGYSGALYYDGSTWHTLYVHDTFAGEGWHFFAATFNDTNNELKLYIDGVLAATPLSTSDHIGYGVLGENTVIGRAGNGNTDFDFDGSIDNVSIYAGVLSADEVTALYRSDPPVAHWKLDEATGTTAEDSAGSADGTVTGTTDWAPGRLDNGFKFDGDTKIQATGLLGAPANITVAAWANLEATGSSGAEIVSLGDHFALRLDSSGTTSAFFYNGSSWEYVSVSATFAGTGWHHFAATFDDAGNKFKLYIDGELANTATKTNSISYSGLGANTVIGRHGNGNTNYDFTGTIDDVRIYDYALTADQIAELYSPDLVTQYDWDCNSNLTQTIGPMGHVTDYEYDELNRLITRTDADPDNNGPLTNPVTQYGYNSLGWLTSVTDPEGNVTFYQYDEMGRRIKDVKVTGPGLLGDYRTSGNAVVENRVDEEIYFSAASDFAGVGGLGNGFVATWSGAIYIDEPGDVTFYLNNTDYAQLFIDDFDTNVFDNPSYDSMAEVDETVALVAGWHTLKITFLDTYWGTDSGLIVSYKLNGGSKVVIPVAALGTAEITTTAYDDAGRVQSLTDPLGNTTSWLYDEVNRVTSETIVIDSAPDSRTYEYEGTHLKQMTDRNDRVTEYDYDGLNRVKTETWLDALDDPIWTIDYTYDDAGNLTSIIDGNATYVYEYDDLNRQRDASLTITGLNPDIDVQRTFDALSRVTSVASTIDATADYGNSYEYDAFGRLTKLTQFDQSGNAIAEKRADFAYNPNGQFSSIARYSGTTSANPVASTDYGYDALGRVGLIHHLGTAPGSTFEQEHRYGYDDASRLTSYADLIDGIMADYGYDQRNQLVSADDSGSVLPDEAYTYDNNGNRDEVDNFTGAAQDYEAGPYNRIVSDDTYTYEYDDEGNRTKRTEIATGNSTEYFWDHRNRLVTLIDYDANGTPTYHEDDSFIRIVHYEYDAQNQLVYTSRYIAGVGTSEASFVYDGGQVVLQFDKSPSGYSLTADDLSHRYLWGPGVDQLLADEQVSSLESAGEVLWAAADHLGSVADVIDSNGDLRIHKVFDTFGNVVDEVRYDTSGDPVTSTDPEYVDEAFSFTGRWNDKDTGLQNNLNRWYDPSVGKWLSEDPIGFNAGDANLYRYVGNSPTNFADPSGLEWVVIGHWGDGSPLYEWRPPAPAPAPAPAPSPIYAPPGIQVGGWRPPADVFLFNYWPFPGDLDHHWGGEAWTWHPFVPGGSSVAPEIQFTYGLPAGIEINKEVSGGLLDSMRRAAELMKCMGRKNEYQDQTSQIEDLENACNERGWPITAKQ